MQNYGIGINAETIFYINCHYKDQKPEYLPLYGLFFKEIIFISTGIIEPFVTAYTGFAMLRRDKYPRRMVMILL
jgi:hypothetical protein